MKSTQINVDAAVSMAVAGAAEAMRSFVTGSHAYGTPTETSDIDLVLLVSHEDLRKLQKLADTVPGPNSGTQTGDVDGSFRFGKLNLLCVRNVQEFTVWRLATEFLKTKAPVTRERAKAYITAKLEKAKNGTKEN